MRVQTGANVGIGGFIITGSAPKPVLIRAIGPSLVGFGIPAGEVLADPVVELHGAGAFVTLTNNNSTMTYVCLPEDQDPRKAKPTKGKANE